MSRVEGVQFHKEAQEVYRHEMRVILRDQEMQALYQSQRREDGKKVKYILSSKELETHLKASSFLKRPAKKLTTLKLRKLFSKWKKCAERATIPQEDTLNSAVIIFKLVVLNLIVEVTVI